jgi:hypothetical protein
MSSEEGRERRGCLCESGVWAAVVEEVGRQAIDYQIRLLFARYHRMTKVWKIDPSPAPSKPSEMTSPEADWKSRQLRI